MGGRSAGARVACRTAGATGAVAVLCLAFPVHPPGRPEKSRLDELDAVTVPTLVVQGDKDPFGMPPDGGPNRTVVRVPGNHSAAQQARRPGGHERLAPDRGYVRRNSSANSSRKCSSAAPP